MGSVEMISMTDARAILEKNLARTDSLITAMDKIYGYNRIYQDGLRQSLSSQVGNLAPQSEEEEYRRLKWSQKYADGVEDIQAREFEGIKRSRGEHAIISLATAFETYYKELLQELLNLSPDFFITRNTRFTDDIRQLVEEPDARDYEEIGSVLNLRNRWHYYRIFDEYSIPFLTPEERDFIECIYAKRNNFVHNAGKEDSRSRAQVTTAGAEHDNQYVSTEAKRMRTKFKRMMFKADEQLRLEVSDRSP